MIQFTVWKSGHQYRGFQCTGHAGYEEDGKDIICAAVSALTFNAVNSIEEFTEDGFQLEQAEDGGFLKLLFSGEPSERAALLMDSLILGIRGISEDCESEYITLIFEEV